jgi:hypothetical protein
VILIEEVLSQERLAALYRACDVLVHPYRGEGFAMPVLEAMACGLPVIATAGGPTDEFCPPQAGWRIRSSRVEFTSERVDGLSTAGRPWVLEPDVGHLAQLMRTAVGERERLAGRRAAARGAAERLGWDEVAARYRARLLALAAGAGAPAPAGGFEFEDAAAPRVLASPAWRGEDRLGELLAQWTRLTSPDDGACLYLLADPRVDGQPAELERRVLETGVALEGAGDVTVLIEPLAEGRHQRLHASVDAYVPLHRACEGHLRMARAAGTAVLALEDEALARFLAGARTALPTA